MNYEKRQKERRQLKKRLDDLWGKIIRSKGRCEWCGQVKPYLNAAHIFSRRFLSTRWDVSNGLCLCPSCHRKAHDRPLDFADFVKTRLGQEEYESLRRKAKYPNKPDLERIYLVLKEIADERRIK
uniref:HNH nuclease domain-containing protein n=1 Tax=Caldisericum exile TaxID=693075 RepID=A0A7C4TXG7_9BACT